MILSRPCPTAHLLKHSLLNLKGFDRQEVIDRLSEIYNDLDNIGLDDF